MELDFNTVVIGAGVAGMTAAIYLKRSNIDVVMLEKSAPGGQINRTSDIENYPGFAHIDGPDLAMNMFNQVTALGVTYKYGDVSIIEDHQDYKSIITDQGTINCKNIILASGRRPRELGLAKEKELIGRGISYCAICDGPLYRNKIVLVVGGGNSAVEETQYLSDIAEKVYLVHRGTSFRADPVEQERLFKKTNVEILYNSNVVELLDEGKKLHGVVVNTDGKPTTINVDAMFICVGSDPETSFLKSLQIEMDAGYVIVDKRMATNIKGIYACGDVIKKDVYQISTAIGDAAIAALSIKKDMQ